MLSTLDAWEIVFGLPHTGCAKTRLRRVIRHLLAQPARGIPRAFVYPTRPGLGSVEVSR